MEEEQVVVVVEESEQSSFGALAGGQRTTLCGCLCIGLRLGVVYVDNDSKPWRYSSPDRNMSPTTRDHSKRLR